MSASLFTGLTPAPADPILGVTEKFRADPRPEKVNLGVGVYLTEEGKTPLMGVVKEAEAALAEAGEPHVYIPISGLPGYGASVQKMVFGAESEVVLSGRAATVQTLGGTGALKTGMDFMHLICGETVAATSKPTWGNHNALLKQAGYELTGYRYYDAANDDVDFNGMIEDLKALPAKTLVILHSCCHNPTGYDLSAEQWKEVIAVCQTNGLTPFLDMAYQGFRDGLDSDAEAIRLFAASGMDFLVATSFSKSFNLYNERIGALTVVTQSATDAAVVMTQLKSVIRANYSNPPAHGAKIVERVLSDPAKFAQWEEELNGMRTRVKSMRKALADEMAALGAKRDFSFVTRQNGMFSFTGLSPEQIDRLAADFGIYAVRNGRICICGLNTKNVGYVARSIAAVL
ncbi:MAG: amino acid aminotransferase [Sutterellaceae bacterium]|nr:amino acid aminotransferase [Sutterellaceae bacterium]